MKGRLTVLVVLFGLSLLPWLFLGGAYTVVIGAEVVKQRAWLTWWTPVVAAIALYPVWMGALLCLGWRLQRVGGWWAALGLFIPAVTFFVLVIIPLAVMAATSSQGDLGPVEVKKPCEDRQSDGSLTIIAWSPRCPHERGASVRIRISVRNDAAAPLMFDTRDVPRSSLLDPYLQALPYRDPRPAYDLVFYGEPTCHQSRLMWLWSETLSEPPPPMFVLGPGEQRTLIDVVWSPPEGVTLVSGRFHFVFRDRFYFTPIDLWPCDRK